VSGAPLFLAATPGVDDQFAQIPPFPGAGLVQMFVSRPNHGVVGKSCGRSMGISPGNAVADNQLGGATRYRQCGRFYSREATDPIPHVIGFYKSIPPGQRIMNFPEVDAANNWWVAAGNELVEFSDNRGVVFRVAHDRPRVENYWIVQAQRSGSRSPTGVFDCLMAGFHSLMMPSRSKSAKVPGNRSLRACRSEMYWEVRLPSGTSPRMPSKAASLSSRVRRGPLPCRGSAASAARAMSTTPIILKFHVIATLFHLQVGVAA